MKKNWLFLILFLSSLIACDNPGNNTASQINSIPLSVTDYEYFAKTYSGEDVEKNFTLKEVNQKAYKESYNNQPANYKLTAYQLENKDGSGTAGVLIKMEIDRVQSALMGKGQRKEATRYFCIPSGSSSEDIHKLYNKSLSDLGYKDFEVFTAFISRLYADSL